MIKQQWYGNGYKEGYPKPALAFIASRFVSCQREQIFLTPPHFFHRPVHDTFYRTTNLKGRKGLNQFLENTVITIL